MDPEFSGRKIGYGKSIYTTQQQAEYFIEKYALSDILIKMPGSISIYDWAIKMNYYSPDKDYMISLVFIQRLSSAYLKYYHYADGRKT